MRRMFDEINTCRRKMVHEMPDLSWSNSVISFARKHEVRDFIFYNPDAYLDMFELDATTKRCFSVFSVARRR